MVAAVRMLVRGVLSLLAFRLTPTQHSFGADEIAVRCS
jgi:hypothetical protein